MYANYNVIVHLLLMMQNKSKSTQTPSCFSSIHSHYLVWQYTFLLMKVSGMQPNSAKKYHSISFFSVSIKI